MSAPGTVPASRIGRHAAFAPPSPTILPVLLLTLLLSSCRIFAPEGARLSIVRVPPAGMVYHGAFPGSATGREDDVTAGDLRAYEQLAGKSLAWVYFSHDWFRGRAFPTATVRMIRDAGSVPFIRLMLRSDFRHWRPESTYTLQRIIDGMFDADLRAWFRSARRYAAPLIVEYGTEVNGDWFAWNGSRHGGGATDAYGDPVEPDGPERFRDAYRHIIRLSREEGARNITWVFHVNSGDAPAEPWNRLENYFPGPSWIDWIGVSVYGAQKPQDNAWPRFRDLMRPLHERLTALAPQVPIVICEFGATRGNPLGSQERWAGEALEDLIGGSWPRVVGFSWWNEGWRNDTNPLHDTDMRLENNPELAKAFRERIGGDPRVLGRVFTGPPAPASP